ncbi:MAG: hypothetical protein ABSH48_17560 [Verrucomicrobiota bacterium]|jgi:hypothetical protein
MKTPREILLNRRRAVEPRLDAIRQAAIASVTARRPGAAQAHAPKPNWAGALASFCLAPWRELVLPSQRVWTGLAAVWAVLILINVSQRDTAGGVNTRHASAPSVMASWQVQQHWMNELLADRSTPPDIDRPRNSAPRPHSEHTGIATG